MHTNRLLLLCCQVKKSCERTCARSNCCSCAVKSRKAVSKPAHEQIVAPVLSSQECNCEQAYARLNCRSCAVRSRMSSEQTCTRTDCCSCAVKSRMSSEQTCTRTDCCSCAVKSRKAVSKHAHGQIVDPVLSRQECPVSRHAHGQIVAPVLSSQEKLWANMRTVKLLILCCQDKNVLWARTNCCSCAVKSRKAVSKHAHGQIVAPVLSSQEKLWANMRAVKSLLLCCQVKNV